MMQLTDAAIAALATGLLGTVHCAAMCGPLVVAGCADERRNGGISTRATFGYFAGRFVSYAMIGSVMGHIGEHAMCVLPVAVVQGIAVAMVAFLAAARGFTILRGTFKPSNALKPDSAGLLELRRKPRQNSAFLTMLLSILPRRGLGLGTATGFLPCGALVPAWALAASTGSAAHGALTMVSFAAASAPGLLIPLFGRGLLRRLSASVPAQAYGVLWLLFALYVALRPIVASAHNHSH